MQCNENNEPTRVIYVMADFTCSATSSTTLCLLCYMLPLMSFTCF